MIRPFRVPLKVPFRGVTEREGILIEGPAGWGEFSPFPEYEASITRRWYRAALEAAQEGWPAPRRARIRVNTTIPAVSPEAAYELAARSGCSTAKVKVAEGDDEGRLQAVRDALGPSGRIRIDANGAWDVDTAARSIRRFDRFGLEYVEQPVATIDEMAALRRLVDVPLAADESIRTAADPVRVAGAAAADIVVLKVQPLGGVRAALQVAEACGVPVVVSSALETSVGLAAGVALAAALPELPYACGLGTATLLGRDVVSDPLLPVAGEVEVRRPTIDEGLLEAAASRADAPEALRRFEAARDAAA